MYRLVDTVAFLKDYLIRPSTIFSPESYSSAASGNCIPAILRENRFCFHFKNIVEDEKHFYLDCSLFKHIRKSIQSSLVYLIHIAFSKFSTIWYFVVHVYQCTCLCVYIVWLTSHSCIMCFSAKKELNWI